MSLIIQLPNNIEKILKGKAALEGLSLERYIAELLTKESLPQQNGNFSESELLELMQLQVSQEDLERYKVLKADFLKGKLSESDSVLFGQLNDLIEIAHAERMKYAAQLATTRGQSLMDVVKEFGLNQIAA